MTGPLRETLVLLIVTDVRDDIALPCWMVRVVTTQIWPYACAPA